jgi:hypothetical protein
VLFVVLLVCVCVCGWVVSVVVFGCDFGELGSVMVVGGVGEGGVYGRGVVLCRWLLAADLAFAIATALSRIASSSSKLSSSLSLSCVLV